MREAVPTPGGVDGFSPTVAPVTPSGGAPGHESSKVTEAATGVPVQREGHADELLGAVLAERYRIDRRVGAGGMGAVYVGTHIALAKKVAVKVIQPRLGADATIAQRFIQEARAASAIGHEHIVQITDFGSTDVGGSFLVMEYLDGEDLSETLRREGPLPWQRVVHLGEQIAWALAAAHKNGIVHRDIKPANCYRVPREHDPDFVKVLDFGLAKVTVDDRREGESLTNTGMLLGTPGYIAPELYRGLKADHRVDIYALGALMHKLLTGELPPMCGSDDDEPMRGLPAPDAVASVLGKTLRENPEQRWSTAHELAAALRAIPRTLHDEPTLVQRVHSGAAATAATVPETTPGGGVITLGPGDRGSSPREPASAPGITAREPTPVSFSSLVTVERDGQRVRLSLGIPAFLLIVGIVGVVVYALTRRDDPPQPLPVAVTQPAALQPAPPSAAPPTAPDPSTPTAPVADPGTTVDAPAVADPAKTDAPPLSDAHKTVDAPPLAEPGEADAPPAADAGKPTPPPVARKRGTPALLSKKLKRCVSGSSLSTYLEVDLRWTTDAEGSIVDDSITLAPEQPQSIGPGVKQCIREATAATDFAWRPQRTYKERVEIGTRPSEPAG
ncbi:MAG: serine/threonine protein kinase [Myxococcales bacterium]|nr:serine/threonine protein kinase [Myxococcales bacterium]